MPWTASSFKSKHWKAATPDQAARAAKIANGILRGGGAEGIAIATAIRRANGGKPSPQSAMMRRRLKRKTQGDNDLQYGV